MEGPVPDGDLPELLPVQQAAAWLGVSPHTIRYYERLGLVRVPRDAQGNRAYDEAAMRRLVFLIRMRVSGMTMTELRRYIDLVEQGPGTKPERLKVMQEHRARVRSKIAQLQFALDITDYKIATYGGNLGDEPTLDESTHKETP